VIAGGGGRGAPLFSAPQPQSGGSTPHGSRRLDAEPEAAASAAADPAHTEGVESSGTGDAAAKAGTAAAGSGETVEGRLVSQGLGRGPAAPGLFAADSGGQTETGIALGLAGALALAGGLGWRRERAGAGVL
jgi:hypothetical protein